MTWWRVRVSPSARHDLVEVLAYTSETFGPRQERHYRKTIKDALSALHDGPNVPGTASRDDIHPGLRSLHVARQGRRGRHMILFQEKPRRVIEVVRILHDAMDLKRHLPTEDG